MLSFILYCDILKKNQIKKNMLLYFIKKIHVKSRYQARVNQNNEFQYFQ